MPHSLTYSLLLAEKAHAFTRGHLSGHQGEKVTTEAEAAESKKAKDKALSALRTTISILEDSIRGLRQDDKRNVAAGEKKTATLAPAKRAAFDDLVASVNKSVREAVGHAPGGMEAATQRKLLDRELQRERMTGRMGSPRDTIKAFVNSMLNKDAKAGLHDQEQSMTKIAESVKPIVDRFDAVLERPYLEEFSATLNIVPVVGLKNNQVVYINTKLDEISATHLKDEWTFFSSLPAGAQPGAGKKVHFFPFNGHLCMSVGTAVWRKKHRDQKDPALQQAADDWPKMYHDDWEKIGDKALPAPDLAAIVPFVEAQKDKTLFHLVILTKDGTVQVLDSDDIHASNTWGTLSCSGVEGGSRSSPPTLKHMAYWNDMAHCIDDQGHSWNARVSFGDKTYKLSDKKQTGPVLELTATEMGPVVLRDDGYLYQRVVENPTSDGADPVLEWKRWIKADGATSLGVASPGVQLDLRLLTRILKDRYITAQSSLVVPLQRIKTFAKSHVTLCDTLLKLTEDYRNADDDTQRELALQAGQELIYTAKPWARKMSQETASGYDTVTIMTSQLKGVKQQLAQQLQILRDKLEGLERLMKTQEEQLSQLKAYFWAAVSAMFLGILVGIVGLVFSFGAAVLAGGVIFGAGLAGTIVLAVKIEELVQQISETSSRIDSTKQAIDTLSGVTINYGDLEVMYSQLNVFWGDLNATANEINEHDDNIATQIGMEIFGSTTEIKAAQKAADDLCTATQTYLEVLYSQGIELPERSRGLTKAPLAWNTRDLLSVSTTDLQLLSIEAAEAARQHQARGETKQHREKMRESVVLAIQSARRAALEPARAGAWYDLPQLKKDAALFKNPIVRGEVAPPGALSQKHTRESDRLWNHIAAVEDRVNDAIRPVVVMLKSVDATCAKVRNLVRKYNELSEKGDDAGVAELRDTLLREAMDKCKEAETYASKANNAFRGINQALTDFQIGLNRMINECEYEKQQAIDEANEKLERHQPCWKVLPELYRTLYCLTLTEVWYRLLGTARVTMDGQALTWKDMAQTVSCCLGNVYGTLDSIYTWVDLDPSCFQKLVDEGWDQISHDSNEVLNILASVGIDVDQFEPGALRRGAPVRRKQTGDSAAVVKAMKAPENLARTVRMAADQARDFFGTMEETLELPYLTDLVAYWNQNETVKRSLQDVVSGLKNHYNDDMRTQYPAISGLWSFSRSAPLYAREISDAEGKYLDTVLTSLVMAAEMPMKAAGNAASDFDAASAALREAMRQIQHNLDQIEQKMAEVDANIDKLEQEERDKILNLIADVVSVIFATGSLLLAVGVLGPVGAAINWAVAIGAGASATGGIIKTVIDGMDLADIEKLLSLAKSTRRDLDKTHQALEKVRPLFSELTSQAASIAASAVDLVGGLQEVQDQAAEWDSVKLSDDDVAAIEDSWKSVEQACLAWMHVFQEQGLKPPAKLRVKTD